MSSDKHLDRLLKDWSYDPQSLSVRLVKGEDGRDVIQMRIDMGILQIETTGRPDGSRFDGFETYLAYLLNCEADEPDFAMSEEQCFEADREFAQYYHRRISWLRLQHYQRAVQDADHTLELMDVCRDHGPDEDWVMSHEQYRPFVLFHRTQALAFLALESEDAEEAVNAINDGLQTLKDLFAEHEAEDLYDEDEMVQKLKQFRESLRSEYELGKTLPERLADAVATEQYELAARLRDEMAQRKK
ncbi:MAG: DNA helicase UvrBC [Pirellulaceae bacterium]